MSAFALQFHALPDEVVEWLISIRNGSGAHFSEIYETIPFVRPVSLAAAPSVGRRRAWFIWSHEAPVQPLAFNAFLNSNPDALVLRVGQLSKDGLEESSLGAKSDRLDLMREWRAIEKQFKKHMKAGAIAVGEDGATARIRQHWLSAGARDLSRSGVRLKPIGGTVSIRPE